MAEPQQTSAAGAARGCRSAALAGRVWRPEPAGPSVVAVRGAELLDITAGLSRPCAICARRPTRPRRCVRLPGSRSARLDEVLANTPRRGRATRSRPWLLAPIDLQAIKAAGVTFAVSMLERVIEERARGDLDAAGGDPRRGEPAGRRRSGKLKPGSPEAARLKQVLIEQGAWSQYLEVGHRAGRRDLHQGAADGRGRHRRWTAGIHPASSWNNPEPEVVLAVVIGRADRRRDAGQRRQPARRGGPLGAAAGQGEGQQRLLRDRAVPAVVRCRFRAGRHPPDDGVAAGGGAGRLPCWRARRRSRRSAAIRPTWWRRW